MALYAFDGTWNFRDQKDAVLSVQPSQYGDDPSFRRDTLETNAHRFREFLGPERSEYLEGPGTRFAWIGRFFGGAFGLGGKWRIRHMYRALGERYHGTRSGQSPDAIIDIVGFSRGSALAVHLANVINERGIPDPRGPRHIAWSYDRLLGWSWRMPKAVRGSEAPVIRFLGLWDTVASIGIPVWPFRNRPTRRWRVTTIPANVSRSFHAMALDEVRATFALVRPQHCAPERHYELWFRGVHSNVGGGYPDRGLSDISLAWMMEMYAWTLDKHPSEAAVEIPEAFTQALARLQPDPADESSAWTGTTRETLLPNPDGELGRPATVAQQAWRAMPPKPLVHHSAYRRTPNLLLDHYSANRRLLRPLPGDAEPVYDPPFFYGATPRQEARDVATDAFYQVPVRASDWLVLDGMPVVRSDDWLGTGRRRQDVMNAITRSTFVLVGVEWLLNGRCAVDALRLPATFKNYDNDDVDAREAAGWIIRVLTALEPFAPRLRAFRAAAATPASATTAAPVVSADGTVTTAV